MHISVFLYLFIHSHILGGRRGRRGRRLGSGLRFPTLGRWGSSSSGERSNLRLPTLGRGGARGVVGQLGQLGLLRCASIFHFKLHDFFTMDQETKNLLF